MTPFPYWFRRGLLVGAAALLVGGSMSSYLAIVGYHPLESVRFGPAVNFIFRLDRILTWPCRIVTGPPRDGSVVEIGVAARFLAIAASSVFWGAWAAALAMAKRGPR